MVGLGVSFAAIGRLLSEFDTLYMTPIMHLFFFIIAVLSGTIEATIAALARW